MPWDHKSYKTESFNCGYLVPFGPTVVQFRLYFRERSLHLFIWRSPWHFQSRCHNPQVQMGGVTGINATRSAMCHSMSSEVIGVASAGLNLLFTPFYSGFFQICPQLTRKSQFLLFPPVFGRHSVIYLLRRNHSSSLDEDLRGVTLMRPSLLYSSNLYLLCISVPQGFPPSSSARRRLHIWLWPWVTCRALWTSLDIFNGLAYLLSMLMNKN